MTTIAWDGKTLAADKRVSEGNGNFTTTKIERFGGALLAVSGDIGVALDILAWFKGHQRPDDYPKPIDTTRIAMLLVIRPGNVVRYCTDAANPYRMEDEQVAFGSGGDFARAAMYCGKTAVEAVEIAAIFDCGTGNGVDSLEFT